MAKVVQKRFLGFLRNRKVKGIISLVITLIPALYFGIRSVLSFVSVYSVRGEDPGLAIMFIGILAFLSLIVGIVDAIISITFFFAFFILLSRFKKELPTYDSGIAGERKTTELLSSLPDSYTVYCNAVIKNGKKSSEIDNIVVGPTGVFAIETKNRRGTISGDGLEEKWLQSKNGRGGKIYESKFYNPVKQVGTHIYNLSHYLSDRGLHVYIHGAVIFVNPDSRLRIDNAPGDIPVFCVSGGGEKELIKFILSAGEKLGEDDTKYIHNALYRTCL